MSEYQNTHDDDLPRFEPWLGMVACSVLPIGAAVYLPKAFPLLMVLTVLLFAGGLIMLRVQSVRRAREPNRTQMARPKVQPTEESLVHEPTEMHGAKRSLAPTAQLQSEDR
jgi:hypothetical protein